MAIAAGFAADLRAAGNHEMALLLMKMANRSIYYLGTSDSSTHHSLEYICSEEGKKQKKNPTTKLNRSAIRMNNLGQNKGQEIHITDVMIAK